MSIKSDTLAQQRQTGGLVVAGCSALLTLASGIAWLTFGQGIIAAGLAVLLTVGLGILSRQTGESVVARMAQAVGLMAQVSLLVAICNGHLWQIDMHMAYFAALAVLAIFADWPVILVAAATVALHHLTLSFLLPALVFNGGGGIGRVLVHAVILVAEAATLMWTALSSVRRPGPAASPAVTPVEPPWPQKRKSGRSTPRRSVAPASAANTKSRPRRRWPPWSTRSPTRSAVWRRGT